MTEKPKDDSEKKTTRLKKEYDSLALKSFFSWKKNMEEADKSHLWN